VEGGGKLPQVVLLAGQLKADGAPITPFTQQAFRGMAPNQGRDLLSACLVTRLGGAAGRANVHYASQVSKGLHIQGLAGELARVELPEYDIETSKGPPSLFLALPDGTQVGTENKKSDGKKLSAFNHMSPFLIFDKRSDTDLGKNLRTKQSNEWAAAGDLEDLGKITPNKWLWNGEGFYDDAAWSLKGKPEVEGEWRPNPELTGREVLNFDDFMGRAKDAAEDNSNYIPKKDLQIDKEMSKTYIKSSIVTKEQNLEKRDNENKFRVVEISIPEDTDVVVMGKPVYNIGDPKPIKIGPLDAQDKGSDLLDFRILRGHEISSLRRFVNNTVSVNKRRQMLGCVAAGLGIILIVRGLRDDQLEAVVENVEVAVRSSRRSIKVDEPPRTQPASGEAN